jgi:ERCC4-related helicase
MTTPYHAKYFAHELTRRRPSDSIEKFMASLSDARVDLNPHQVDAALFAFRSPLSKGAILADEVGLGKTIEAGILISQKWAERKRRLLIVCPANLRKQWSQELVDKFYLPSIILEARTFNEQIKAKNLNPFIQDKVVICSYQFARTKEPYISQGEWDLVVIDEAHRLRNVYKSSSKIANAIKTALAPFPKILLTATPLQNSLLELYGLVSIIDDFTFGDIDSFKDQFARLTSQNSFDELKERLKPVCKRTLRRQVLEYVKYTNRIALVQEFFPTDAEQQLYDKVSAYLQREDLYALPKSQRKLMTLILRRLLASSTFAISGTLHGMSKRLETLLSEQPQAGSASTEDAFVAEVAQTYETFQETAEEWIDDEDEDDDGGKESEILTPEQKESVRREMEELKSFGDLAQSIIRNSKGEALLTALKRGLKEATAKGAAHKAIIFTESTRTQNYILELLERTEFSGKVVLFNGSNNDSKSKAIYQAWLKQHEGTDRVTGSPTADKRAALVDYFRDHASIMIATEAAAEGINLQFCSLVVNYDLPWNPQRIEQRIGRCHRYGQKHDVVVVNFLNKANAADQRVYELLAEKFQLFNGVFGASDEVLGAIESGVDFERRIAEIYQKCRTEEQISTSFDALQQELAGEIDTQMKLTRQKLLENFDEEVQEKLRISLKESKEYLGRFEQRLWALTKYFLRDVAVFAKEEFSFALSSNPFPGEIIHPGPYRLGSDEGDVNLYRVGHPLAQRIIEECKSLDLQSSHLEFELSNSGRQIAILSPLIGKSGSLKVMKYTFDSFEPLDEVILVGLADSGEVLDHEQCEKLFSLDAKTRAGSNGSSTRLSEKLDTLVAERVQSTKEQISNKDAEYFETELDKLDHWAEDQRSSLKLSLKETDERIKELKKQARSAGNLPDKLKLEKERRNLETRRDELWRAYDAAAKDIEVKKDKLIDRVQQLMEQRITHEELFTISWTVI